MSAPAPALLALVVACGVLTGGTAARGLGWGLVAAVFFSLAPFAVILAAVARGRAGDHHVSAREQRPLLLGAALTSFTAGTVVLGLLGAPHRLVAALVALVAAAVVASVITLRWKVSLHLAVLGCAVALLSRLCGPVVLVSLPVLAAVGWSRVHLRAHTVAQVVAGALVGAAVSGAVFGLLA